MLIVQCLGALEEPFCNMILPGICSKLGPANIVKCVFGICFQQVPYSVLCVFDLRHLGSWNFGATGNLSGVQHGCEICLPEGKFSIQVWVPRGTAPCLGKLNFHMSVILVGDKSPAIFP